MCLLNVEGKIFFGVIAKRMTRFVVNNGYVNTSIQKARIPDFPGCIEYPTMLWERIKTAKNNKSAILHVIWLNLENAYVSARHQLLEKANWSSFGFQKILKTSYQLTLNVRIRGFLINI